MSSHSHSHGHSPGVARQSSTAPWIVVAALIAGALALGGALVAASVVLLVIGVAVVLVALACAALLSRRGAASLSFTQEYPANTYGPRGTSDGDSSPPIDTHPNGLPGRDTDVSEARPGDENR